MLENNFFPTVAILLPTYNGEAFLEEQLESILRQEKVLLKVYIRDDASTDSTVQILKKYKDKFEIFFSKTNIGTSASLLKLLHLAEDYDYVAFCDQDDVWDADHLFQAVQSLTKAKEKSCAFYFPQYNYINSQSKLIGTRIPAENIGLSNALVENPIIGCGLVFNKFAAKKIMQFELSPDYHLDHQIYFLGTLIGKIYQGSSCTINYRIHDGNQVGISLGFWFRFKDFVQIFRKFNQIRVQQLALRKIFLQVSENVFQGSLSSPGLHFTAVCNRSVIVRLKYFFYPQFRRQNRFDQTLFRLIFIMLT